MLSHRYVDLFTKKFPGGTIALVGPLEAVKVMNLEISQKFPSAEPMALPQQAGWTNQRYGKELLEATKHCNGNILVIICGQVNSAFSYCHNATIPLKARGDIVVTVQGKVIQTGGNPAPLATMSQSEILSFVSRYLNANIKGDYLEFGTFDGRSLSVAYYALKDKVGRFLGFDSFEGIIGACQDEDWFDGTFVANQNTLEFNMEIAGIDMSRFAAVKGNFLESLTPDLYETHALRTCSVAHIDCDVYAPAKAALNFLTPLLRQGSIIMFDDFHGNGASNKKGERRALSEWLSESPGLDVERLFDYGVIGRAYVVHKD